ncbi:MAG TPA: LytTR family DNA-binding domain-containing protein [Chitinophagaceae bacterium]|nr:LytTR family DNA-binding domain-containing protein [Chitinophagaceae bacterium]
MKVVIIEDEKLTAEDLAGTIAKVESSMQVVAVLYSVTEALAWFSDNEEPDIIFSDIQLGDGLSFKIFDAIASNIPVIFCTAYDEYALQAFKTAGIDYILKPFSTKTIAAAIEKYKNLQQQFTKSVASYEAFGSGLKELRKQNAIMVFYKDKILPVRLDNIALFYLRNNLTHLVTFDKEQYYINETLEETEKITGSKFYRVSRQHLVNRMAIKDVSKYFNRKLLVNLTLPFNEKITVSKVKASSFLEWLACG